MLLSSAGTWLMIAHFQYTYASGGGALDPIAQGDGTARFLTAGRDSLFGSPPRTTLAGEMARRALAIDPLSVGALSLLADVYDQEGELSRALRIRRELLSHTARDLGTQRRMLQYALAQGEAAQAVRHIDAILRLRPRYDTSPQVLATLATLSFLAADISVRPAIVQLLAKNPPWRDSFLYVLATKAPPELFLDLVTRSDRGMRTADISSAWREYLYRLINAGKGDEAYAIWVGLLPSDETSSLAPLYNGDFSRQFSGLPFDWEVRWDKGLSISRRPDPTVGTTILEVAFSGVPMQFQHIWHYLNLAPGLHRLTGRVEMRQLQTTRGLRWRLYCQESDRTAILAESVPFSGTAPWDEFKLDFDIPQQGCRGQMLRLELAARIPAERSISGYIAFADLSVGSLPD